MKKFVNSGLVIVSLTINFLGVLLSFGVLLSSNTHVSIGPTLFNYAYSFSPTVFGWVRSYLLS